MKQRRIQIQAVHNGEVRRLSLLGWARELGVTEHAVRAGYYEHAKRGQALIDYALSTKPHSNRMEKLRRAQRAFLYGLA